ncbi:hypothetical protein E6H29_12195 [Candidatus Bathyarchaeota archaeon]|nr:MAG: hypothetical protein E6H29_12195 [Candidatus Bathyarchaeota archaeon]
MLDHGLLEEAKGDYVSASRLHERASDLFQSTLSRDPIDERADVLFALDLSKGWSVLCAARADSDPREYLRAAKLFKAAAGKSPNVRSGQYAMGNRFLSEALASETRFAVSADPKLYRTAKRCLKNASTCYSRANMDRSSLIVDARLSLLDASLYSTRAEASPDPRRIQEGWGQLEPAGSGKDSGESLREKASGKTIERDARTSCRSVARFTDFWPSIRPRICDRDHPG